MHSLVDTVPVEVAVQGFHTLVTGHSHQRGLVHFLVLGNALERAPTNRPAAEGRVRRAKSLVDLAVEAQRFAEKEWIGDSRARQLEKGGKFLSPGRWAVRNHLVLPFAHLDTLALLDEGCDAARWSERHRLRFEFGDVPLPGAQEPQQHQEGTNVRFRAVVDRGLDVRCRCSCLVNRLVLESQVFPRFLGGVPNRGLGELDADVQAVRREPAQVLERSLEERHFAEERLRQPGAASRARARLEVVENRFGEREIEKRWRCSDLFLESVK